MRPLVRSYGVVSTVTRSPARMRMRFFFIRPEVYASTSCPLSKATRKRASGRTSLTTPSNSTRSSLAKAGVFLFKLQGLQICRFGLAGAALLEVERDLLAFGQARQTRTLDGGNMHERILPALIRGDKAETLGRIEPLNNASRHDCSPIL